MVTNTCAAITFGIALCLLLEGDFKLRYNVPALVTGFFHLVSITTMRVPFFAGLLEAHSVLRALTSRVSIEVAWLLLLIAMWLAVSMDVRTVFLCRNPRMCPIHARDLDSNSLL